VNFSPLLLCALRKVSGPELSIQTRQCRRCQQQGRNQEWQLRVQQLPQWRIDASQRSQTPTLPRSTCLVLQITTRALSLNKAFEFATVRGLKKVSFSGRLSILQWADINVKRGISCGNLCKNIPLHIWIPGARLLPEQCNNMHQEKREQDRESSAGA
jgi:endogenous inhibitor of DNA gyrase (YacG/DUF329 family)